MAKDPVCGMEVSPETATASAEFDGATYYFCAQSCKDAFLAEPHRYLDGEVGKKGGTGLLSRLLRRRCAPAPVRARLERPPNRAW